MKWQRKHILEYSILKLAYDYRHKPNITTWDCAPSDSQDIKSYFSHINPKVVWKKIEQLEAKGYLERSIITWTPRSYLTEKGLAKYKEYVAVAQSGESVL